MLIPLGILDGVARGFPSGITGLVARYDAQDLTSIAVSGSNVTQWNDLSGNGFHATQATGTRQPLSGTRTINGKNALDFDGTNDFLINAGIASSFTGEDKPYTIFMVSTSDTTAGTLTSWSIASTSDGRNRIFTNGNALISGDNANTEVALTITGSYNTNNQFLTWRSSGLNFTGYINTTLTNTGTAYNQGTINLNTASIGTLRNSDFSNGVQFWNGLIGEVIYYNRQLTTDEVALVHGYLGSRWGI
jgi:hypothetical protein